MGNPASRRRVQRRRRSARPTTTADASARAAAGATQRSVAPALPPEGAGTGAYRPRGGAWSTSSALRPIMVRRACAASAGTGSPTSMANSSSASGSRAGGGTSASKTEARLSESRPEESGSEESRSEASRSVLRSVSSSGSRGAGRSFGPVGQIRVQVRVGDLRRPAGRAARLLPYRPRQLRREPVEQAQGRGLGRVGRYVGRPALRECRAPEGEGGAARGRFQPYGQGELGRARAADLDPLALEGEHVAVLLGDAQSASVGDGAPAEADLQPARDGRLARILLEPRHTARDPGGIAQRLPE